MAVFDVTAPPFGAVGKGTADDRTAIAKAIAAAKNGVTTDELTFARAGKVLFPAGRRFKITSEITIPTRGMALEAESTEGATIFCATDRACIRTAGSVFGAQTLFRNLFFDGYAVAKRALVLNDEECRLENVTVYNFTDAGIEINASIQRLDNVRILTCPTLLRLNNCAAITIVGGNFFGGTTAAIDCRGNVTSVAIQGTWFEAFQRVVRIWNDVGSVNVGNLSLQQCHLLSTVSNARVVSMIASNPSSTTCRAVPIAIRDTTFYLSNTQSACVVQLQGNTNGNSKLHISLENILVANGEKMNELLLTDSNETRAAFVGFIESEPPIELMTGKGVVSRL